MMSYTLYYIYHPQQAWPHHSDCDPRQAHVTRQLDHRPLGRNRRRRGNLSLLRDRLWPHPLLAGFPRAQTSSRPSTIPAGLPQYAIARPCLFIGGFASWQHGSGTDRKDLGPVQSRPGAAGGVPFLRSPTRTVEGAASPHCARTGDPEVCHGCRDLCGHGCLARAR